MEREQLKRCSTCEEEKPLSAFSNEKKNKDGKRYDCKECRGISIGVNGSSYRNNRKSTLKNRYGISLKQYDILLQKQKNCCAICGKHQSELTKILSVDHNHETGKFRGLLCPCCNSGLGMFAESRGNLIRAIQYLTKYEKKERKNG